MALPEEPPEELPPDLLVSAGAALEVKVKVCAAEDILAVDTADDRPAATATTAEMAFSEATAAAAEEATNTDEAG